ncbi:MAG TPA: DsbA family protein [Cytophagaceae bacterium]|jgi:predicted DsbA family dithiol-disulfide isomerase
MENSKNEGGVEITYYTDPLCCWSWAMEPQWRKLRYEFRGKIAWKYKMGGLIPNWNNYNDTVFSITRPAQMGPMWMEAQQISGMPMEDRIWITNPPSSSYQACIAVKCAEMQSLEAAEIYLRHLREAVMLRGINISNQKTQIQLAEELCNKLPMIFDSKIFIKRLIEEEGIPLFQDDLQKARYFNISRFPTLVFSMPKRPSILLIGYRPYESLRQALLRIAPELEPLDMLSNDKYLNYWGSMTERELDEIKVNTGVA